MRTTSRRKFLQGMSSLGASATLLERLRGARTPRPAQDVSASGPNLHFPTEPRQRLAVASWPFRAFIESPTNYSRDRKQPGMDLKDFAAMVLKKFELQNIEPLSDHFRSTDPAYLREFREAVEQTGARVIDIAVSARYSFYDPDPSRRGRAVADGKKWLDIAVAIGSSSIRTHIEGVHNVKPDVDRTAESLRQLTAYAAEKKVVVNLENDDPMSEDAFFIVKVIKKVNHPYLHALPDFCNSMLSGNAQFNYDAVTAMFKHAYNISHMKDSEVENGKLYTIDVGRTFEIAKASGYRGYFSMEWEGQAGPYEGTQKLIQESLKYLA